jgi:hypothetical protein
MMKLLLGIRLLFVRIGRYEFWPVWLFYFPMYFYGLYLALRAGSFTYFTRVNPGMKYGGAFDMLKFDILKRIDPAYIPRCIRIWPGITPEEIRQSMAETGLEFPIVAKPDIGERGKGVELVDDQAGLEKYLAGRQENVILQEYICYPVELGVLYYKYPDGSGEEVTSVVIRDFLTVRGDGKNTLRKLMEHKTRTLLRRKYLFLKYRDKLDEIIPDNKEILLEPIGNHNRGTRFLNGNQLINKQLLKVISDIAAEIHGFDYGRFDLKVKNLEDLYQGRDIKILELNGVNSEPAHIYDPGYRLFKAYRDIARHMMIIYRISRMNHKNGIQHASFRRFTLDLKNHLYPRQK